MEHLIFFGDGKKTKDFMAEIGYALSSEEHLPGDLVRYAKLAEQIGFRFALISDHYHPWISRQGHSPFVWSVIGGSSQVTHRLFVGTGVTCPTVRIHPARSALWLIFPERHPVFAARGYRE